MTDAATGESFEALDLGVLQTTKELASITAVMRAKSSGDTHAASIIIEYADPFVDGRPRTVTIDLHGKSRISGVLQ